METCRFTRLLVVFSVLLIGSCAKPQLVPMPRTHVPPDTLPQVGTIRPPETKPATPKRVRPAVVDTMISKAKKQLNNRRPDAAFRTLERALAVDGRDPLIWHLMAKARFQQGQYAQAKSLAGKSNTLAGGNAALRKKNRDIIKQSKASLISSQKD